MPLVDDEGNPIDMPVSEPSEVPSRLATLPSALKAIAPPLAANVGVEAGLTAAGLPEVGLLPTLIRSLAAGGTNVATSKALPERFGGQPKASALSDFAWGAIPQGLAEGGKAGLQGLFNRRLAHAGGQFMEQARKGLLDPENLTVQEQLLAPQSRVPFPNILQPGPQLTQQANEARGPIQRIIQQARTKYGRPIGDAYQALKGDEPLDETEGADLAEGAQNTVQSMISPGPLTRTYAQLMQKWAPAKDLGIEHRDIELPGGEIVRHEPKPESPPPTLDQVRNLRQQINADLQRAKGGDVYGLGMLQDQLDERLMDHLPENMQELRTQYRGFIKRWGYDREHRLANLADPNEITNEVFKNPRDAYELYTEAAGRSMGRSSETTITVNGQTRTIRSGDAANAQVDALRERFIQYVWGDLDPMAPSSKQADAVRKKLAPYMRDTQTARAMLGNQPGDRMREMVAWAKYAPDLNQQLQKNPQTRQQFQGAFDEYFLRQGRKPAEAATLATQKLIAQAPGASNIVGQTPMLPPAVGGGRQSFSNVLAGRHGAMTGLAIAMARPEAAVYQAAMAVSWLAHSNGFTAASKLGATRFFINAFKAGSPLEKGWWFARAMDTVAQGGAQTLRQAQPVETDNAP